ncbi:MAG: hypothetical protein DRO06_04850, partial [Thermoproteota archaeon]
MYEQGETVRISIYEEYMGAPLGGESVNVQVKSPSGAVVFSTTVVTNAQGRASTSYALPPDAETGSYSVVADDPLLHMTGTCSFRVVPSEVVRPSVSLTAPERGLLGEELSIVVRVDPPHEAEVVLHVEPPEREPFDLTFEPPPGVKSGEVSFSLVPDSCGNWTLWAEVLPSRGFEGAESGVAVVDVREWESSVSLAPESEGGFVGRPARFTARVGPPDMAASASLTLEFASQSGWIPCASTIIEGGGNYTLEWTPPAPGTYILRAVVSGNVRVFGSESGRVFFRVSEAGVDLVVSWIGAVPEPLYSGGPLRSVRAIVQNAGSDESGEFSVSGSYSVDGGGSGSLSMAQPGTPEEIWRVSLAPGEAVVVTLYPEGGTAALPRDASSVRITVEADPLGEVTESDEGNNALTSVLPVEALSPNLELRSLRLTPCPGEAPGEGYVILTALVASSGEAPVPEGGSSGPVSVSFSVAGSEVARVSVTFPPDPSAIREVSLALAESEAALEAAAEGAPVPPSGSAVVPGLFSSPREFSATVDPDDEVPESSESDNSASTHADWSDSSCRLPDLAVYPADFSAELVGSEVRVSGSVWNLGYSAAESTLQVGVETPEGLEVLAEVPVGPIPPGGVEGVSASAEVRAPGGEAPLRVSVDPGGLLPELDEGNNEARLRARASPLDLGLELEGCSGYLGPGGVLRVGFYLSSEGPVDLEACRFVRVSIGTNASASSEALIPCALLAAGEVYWEEPLTLPGSIGPGARAVLVSAEASSPLWDPDPSDNSGEV